MAHPAAGAVSDLAALVRIPSVSSDPAHVGDVARAAAWTAARCRRAGFERVEVLAGRRHQVVVAEHRPAPSRPTILLYAHYDVQPPGPRAAWRTPPFEPTLRGRDLHGRGASDDKGQLLCEVLAAERLLRGPAAPVNVVLVADGEEEVGSPTMPHLLAARVGVWRPTAAVVCDTRMLGPGRPAFTVGLRGSLACELTVEGPPADLHSGQFGGAVHNPVQVLCEAIAGLHDAHGRIAVPGIYDDVRAAPRCARPPRSDAGLLAAAGVRDGWGERGYTAYERTTSRPSLTVAGIAGGHRGPGVKSIIPARATAKLALRLVPDQRPDRVERLLRRHLAAVLPPTVGWRLHRYSASRPVLLDAGDPAHRAAARACQQVWGAPPALLRSGGSIPIVELLARRCGVPTVLLGFALPGDNAHAPNERFHLPHLELGARTLELMLADLGEEAQPSRQRRRRSGTVRSARPAAASFSRGRASRLRRGQPP